MYNETYEALCEGLVENTSIKRAILKNQLDYCFENLSENHRGDTGAIVRRVLAAFPLANIIGVQPINDDYTTIKIDGIEKDIDINRDVKHRGLQTVLTEIDENDLLDKYGLDLWSEICLAVSYEVEDEITSEMLHTIHKEAIPCACDLDSAASPAEGIADAIMVAAEQVKGNWAIASPILISVLQASNCFEIVEPELKTSSGLVLVGILEGEVKIYSNLHLAYDDIIIGGKEEGNEDTGIIYIPHTMLTIRDKITDAKGEKTRLMTRYGVGYRKDRGDLYRKITVDVPFE